MSYKTLAEMVKHLRNDHNKTNLEERKQEVRPLAHLKMRNKKGQQSTKKRYRILAKPLSEDEQKRTGKKRGITLEFDPKTNTSWN